MYNRPGATSWRSQILSNRLFGMSVLSLRLPARLASSL
jgi:hypothetical protein